MSQTLSEEFGTLRSLFWPIRRHECRKVVPMLCMLFLVCFNYSILRNMKDSVVVTTAGAETLPFIKVYALLPMAIILTYIFSKLCNRYSQEQVTYIVTSGFLIFYAVFAFILFPLQDYIHPHALAETLINRLPPWMKGLEGLIQMFHYWTFTAFYVMAELWASIVQSVIFWGFVNEITRLGEARRFYAVLSIGTNISAISAGLAANYFSTGGVFNSKIPFGKTAWEQTLMMLILINIISGIITMIIFRWMNKNVLNDPSFDELHEQKREFNKKKKLTIRESIAFLSNSKYLIYIAVLVVGYNLVINMVEMIWKGQLRQLYPDPSDFNIYMNQLTTTVGIISTCTACFIPRIMSRFGWSVTAMITPMIMLVTSIGFFTFMFFQDFLSGIVMGFLGTTPLAIVVFFGAAQNCLSKAAKYSVFDTTKEMAFIPLEHELKLKGKAAIDGVGSRLGKSGGSFIHQGLLALFGSFAVSAPYVAVILLAAIFLWIIAVKALGIEFDLLVATRRREEKAEASEEVQEESPTTITTEEQPVIA